MSDTSTTESVESFTLRAREWLAANMPPLPAGHERHGLVARPRSDEEELARIARGREL